MGNNDSRSMFVNENEDFFFNFSINVSKTCQNFNKHWDHFRFKADFQVLDTMGVLIHFMQVSWLPLSLKDLIASVSEAPQRLQKKKKKENRPILVLKKVLWPAFLSFLIKSYKLECKLTVDSQYSFLFFIYYLKNSCSQVLHTTSSAKAIGKQPWW